MDYQHSSPSRPPQKKSFLDAVPSKTAFGLGFITAILSLGTLGFVVMTGCALSGGCDGLSVGGNGSTVVATPPEGSPTAAPTAGAPSDAPSGAIAVVTDEDHIRGNKDAKITIIEYSDFECPFCERFHPTVQQAMDEFGDDVRWVFRHFPLSFHPEAEPAAIDSECAAEQGKFWEFGDALFENQATLGQALYTSLASDLGLNAKKFADCLVDPEMKQRVADDAQSGATAGVSGTPGSFVIDADGNAVSIKGAQPYSALQSAINAAL